MKNVITVGEIVAKDYRAAEIFRAAGIDFCCGGKKSLDEICSGKNIDKEEILAKLKELESVPNTTTHNFVEWEPGFLCDYIMNIHHKYVLKTLPELVFYTGKIASVHGEGHPELEEVASLFSQVNKELLQHLKKEEEVLFPAIKEFQASGSEASKEIIRNEILRLSDEHEFAGGAMDKINELTSGYKVPDDGCNSYRVAFTLLNQFEDDLHTHVHLENNVLFPKVLASAI
jgi:regulator of cell morphogenesis and NO signaling